MTTSESLRNKFALPLGSAIVDGALVLSLVFSIGQMTERFEAMDARLQRIEEIGVETRINAVELRAAQSERQQADLKQDIVKRLDRIERLLDEGRR